MSLQVDKDNLVEKTKGQIGMKRYEWSQKHEVAFLADVALA